MAHVLLAYDGSTVALHAAQQGLAILGAAADEVELVEVVAPAMPTLVALSGAGPAAPLATGATIEEASRRSIAEAHDELDNAARQLPVAVKTEVLVGDPGIELCHAAATKHADLIVVGSHGTGWLKRVVLGSVSQYVAHHAPCPVLVVRSPNPDS